MGIIQKIKYKLWYIALSRYIKEQKFASGAEIGVKAGRSYFFYLKRNKKLRMIGLDLWENQPDSPYKNNLKNGEIALKRNKQFENRSTLYKGDAVLIGSKIKDGSLDFIFYDLFNYRVSKIELHREIIKPWLAKLKSNGVLIGRDFHEPDIAQAIKELTSKPIAPIIINGRPHIRLKEVRLQ
jgi:hypothetical protein